MQSSGSLPLETHGLGRRVSLSAIYMFIPPLTAITWPVM